MAHYKIKITDLSRFDRSSKYGNLIYDGLMLLSLNTGVEVLTDVGDFYKTTVFEFSIHLKGEPILSTIMNTLIHNTPIRYEEGNRTHIGNPGYCYSMSKDMTRRSQSFMSEDSWSPECPLCFDSEFSDETVEVSSLGKFAAQQNYLIELFKNDQSFISNFTGVKSIFCYR